MVSAAAFFCLALLFSTTPLVASAASSYNDNVLIYSGVEIDYSGGNTKDVLTTQEALSIIQNSPGRFSLEAEITIEEAIAHGTITKTSSTTGTGTYEERKATGTPGVYWKVKLNFSYGTNSSGNYYFTNVTSSSQTIVKNFWGALWATAILTDLSNSYYGYRSNKTKIIVYTDIHFTVYYEGSILPIEYDEHQEILFSVADAI